VGASLTGKVESWALKFARVGAKYAGAVAPGQKKSPRPIRQLQSSSPEPESQSVTKIDKWLKLANRILRVRKRKRSA
jgi:hypothetical protein